LGHYKPLLVNIEPTHRCNLSCFYCDKALPGGPRMDTVKTLALIDELADMGTISVCFDGGEPFVHPGILFMVRRAKERGLRVAMSSNGMLFEKKPHVLDYVDVMKISLDGPPEVHDFGRGPGVYEKSMRGARYAVERGLDVSLRMTLASHNAGQHRHVLEAAKSIGAKALFQPASGSLMDLGARPAPHSAEVVAYRAAIDDLMALKKAGEPVGNEWVSLEHLRKWPEPAAVPACSGGRIEVAIGPDGGMFPCGRYGRKRAAPNVFELGARRAFEELLRPDDCRDCWCALTAAGCYMHGADVRMLKRW
jgi:MoaA/NifB/PqqE/SkfB family radical SAM enzyme